MRFIVMLILLSMSSHLLGANVKCYSNGRMIYSGNGKDVLYDNGVFAFIEHPSRKVVYISGDCVIKVLQ